MRKFSVKREGKCIKCGYCCPPNCLHLKNGFCEIYAIRDKFCEECGETHQNCIDAPMFPMRKVNVKCGYRFYVVGEKQEAVLIETVMKK